MDPRKGTQQGCARPWRKRGSEKTTWDFSHLVRVFVSTTLVAATLVFGLRAPHAAAAANPSYDMPFSCGQSGWRVSTYPNHGGGEFAVDFNLAVGDQGQPVLASADGVVQVPAYSGSSSAPLAIDHDGGGWRSGAATLYLHMERTVANGTQVRRGDIVGYVSDVGAPGGSHLHYEQRLNGVTQPIIFSNYIV